MSGIGADPSGFHPGRSRVGALDAGLSIATTVPLHGVEPSHVVPATRADDRNRLVAAFRK